ncbi:hypothetical protein M9Y10_042639 [Tritrichomonas musculus]|uniref:USP domain-containing protein n=1 Tax=Tritrichomonas musculus TaxID=1915356 RepID=A0ABR2JXF5_9EUKA
MFKAYIKQEELTGDNQYKTDNFGKQDAIMGTEFLEFPPILHIHLRRFMFDMDSFEGMIKINDRFEFPETIDLTEYLVQDSPQKSKSNIYDLYGVLVHYGGYSGGHYYAFLRTSTDPQWYKFNDSIVSKESVQKAVYDNYGSKERFYSAYMLIYVRRNDAQSLYEPISDDLVPEHLKMYKESTQIKENEIKVYFMHEFCLKSNVADKVLGFFPKIKEGFQFVSDDRIHMEKYDRSTTASELYALL